RGQPLGQADQLQRQVEPGTAGGQRADQQGLLRAQRLRCGQRADELDQRPDATGAQGDGKDNEDLPADQSPGCQTDAGLVLLHGHVWTLAGRKVCAARPPGCAGRLSRPSGGQGRSVRDQEVRRPEQRPAAQPPREGPPEPGVRRRRRAVAGELTVLAAYLAAGIAVTWPRVATGPGRVPAVRDISSYVWALWWVAHQAIHLANPFFTGSMAAPAGIQLGYNTTMPLLGVVLAPVTLTAGPAAAFWLITIVLPGLLCYVMYRTARLWLARPGAIAAGALYGLAAMLDWQVWF